MRDSGCGTAGGGNGGPHQQEFNPFLLSCLWGAVLVAHKMGSFLKPPVPLVQHEVRVDDGPSQPQPTMTISRSQSPLPSVDWKTYTSSGRKQRPPAASSPTPHRERRAGAGILRETAPFPRYWGGTGQGLFLLWSLHSQRPPHPKIRGASLPAVPLSQQDLRCSEPKNTQYL